ncbi:M15 family metallopeptidase [Myxosarcina sp. GI1]|uniref:M15 family metallopeptidase n=1 Tax=Myxosarcina sp. GI1 TaxID=1541065 RepID=UPI000562C867|nr:M15 family metallopeptidase [Myxosarcina sp. GI1]
MRPDRYIPIQECGEPLIAIPLEHFAVESPHPYQKLGAPYDDKSPYYLRKGVVNALLEARELLIQQHPHWKLKIFDAYRPIAVQQFMVDYTFNSLAAQYDPTKLSSQQRQNLWERVYQLWAVPSNDPATPPPHSTGSAVDLTIVDEHGNDLDMGGDIDELSERSHPDYYANDNNIESQQYHRHRLLLNRVMSEAGFCRHPGEWWHFSLGDRMWAWLNSKDDTLVKAIARYGGI